MRPGTRPNFPTRMLTPEMPSPQAVFVGLTTLDVIQRVTSEPRWGRKGVSESSELVAGGPAANAAVTFAALIGSATSRDRSRSRWRGRSREGVDIAVVEFAACIDGGGRFRSLKRDWLGTGDHQDARPVAVLFTGFGRVIFSVLRSKNGFDDEPKRILGRSYVENP
jgi:hypothetical protein